MCICIRLQGATEGEILKNRDEDAKKEMQRLYRHYIGITYIYIRINISIYIYECMYVCVCIRRGYNINAPPLECGRAVRDFFNG